MLQNVGLSLALITVLIPLALTGVLGLAAVVAVHELAEIVVIANGVRAGRTKPLGAPSSKPEPTPTGWPTPATRRPRQPAELGPQHRGKTPDRSRQRRRTPKRRQHAIPGRKVQSARISCQLSARLHDIHTINEHCWRWISTDPFHHHIFSDINLRQTLGEQAPSRRRIRTSRS